MQAGPRAYIGRLASVFFNHPFRPEMAGEGSRERRAGRDELAGDRRLVEHQAQETGRG